MYCVREQRIVVSDHPRFVSTVTIRKIARLHFANNFLTHLEISYKVVNSTMSDYRPFVSTISFWSTFKVVRSVTFFLYFVNLTRLLMVLCLATLSPLLLFPLEPSPKLTDRQRSYTTFNCSNYQQLHQYLISPISPRNP